MTRTILISFLTLIALPCAADQIRNRYTHQILRVTKRSDVEVGIPGKRLETAQWHFTQEKKKNGASICLKDHPRKCLTLDGKDVILANWAGKITQLWQREEVPDTIFYRIRNTSRPNAYLNNEGGPLTVGAIKSGWWSAMWAFDENPSQDARSVHLHYDAITNASDAYIETKVVESHKNTYFAALVFNGGYVGIQELGGDYCQLPNGEHINKQVIFSLWNEDGSREKNPPQSALARVVRKGPGVTERAFGGEGSGAQTTKCMQWNVGEVYRFYIRSRVEGRYSFYAAYVRGPNDANWTFIADLKRPTRGILINDAYSFVEDFGRSGTAEGVSKDERTPFCRRAADFMNPWFKQPSRSWTPVRKALFTAWGEDHPQSNISAGVINESGIVFRLETGGKVVQKTKLNTTIQSTQAPTKAPQPPK